MTTNTKPMSDIEFAEALVRESQERVLYNTKYNQQASLQGSIDGLKKAKADLEALKNPTGVFVIPSKDVEFLKSELDKCRKWVKERPVYASDYQPTWETIYRLEARLDQALKK